MIYVAAIVVVLWAAGMLLAFALCRVAAGGDRQEVYEPAVFVSSPPFPCIDAGVDWRLGWPGGYVLIWMCSRSIARADAVRSGEGGREAGDRSPTGPVDLARPDRGARP